jgi:hypothetical protein
VSIVRCYSMGQSKEIFDLIFWQIRDILQTYNGPACPLRNTEQNIIYAMFYAWHCLVFSK